MSPAYRTLIAVALGGAVGSLLRWLLEVLLPVAAGTVPWPTFLANVLGSAALGVVVVALDRGAGSAALRGFLTTGLLGGFTTFSFYAVQVTVLGQVAPVLALTYLVLTPLACVGAAWLAASWARRIWGMP